MVFSSTFGVSKYLVPQRYFCLLDPPYDFLDLSKTIALKRGLLYLDYCHWLLNK
jgi:hypothetical protein